MTTGIWGRKIGMTQVFANDKVVPVTAIDVAGWYVTNVKAAERDGYNALQVGKVKDRYVAEKYSKEWIKQPNQYYSFVREILLKDTTTEYVVGKAIDFSQLVQLGDKVDVRSKTIGKSFAGVVKRHRFRGPRGSHG